MENNVNFGCTFKELHFRPRFVYILYFGRETLIRFDLNLGVKNAEKHTTPKN